MFPTIPALGQALMSTSIAMQTPLSSWVVLLAPLAVPFVLIASRIARATSRKRPEPAWPDYSTRNRVYTKCPACVHHPY